MTIARLLTSLLAAAAPQTTTPEIPLSLLARRAAEPPVAGPGGRWMAVCVREPPPGGLPGARLHLVNVDTGAATVVSPEGCRASRAVFSPDGASIAFFCESEGLTELWKVDVASCKAARVCERPIRAPRAWHEGPAWTPDGKSILAAFLPANASEPPVAPSDVVELSARASDVEAAERARLERAHGAALGLVNVASGEVTLLVTSAAPLVPASGLLSPSGRFVAVRGVPRPAGPAARASEGLAVFDIEGRRIVTKLDSLDTNGEGRGGAAVRWHPTRDRLYYVEKARLRELDLTKEGAEPRTLAGALGAVDARHIGFPSDGETLLVGLIGVSTGIDREGSLQNLAVVPLGAGPLLTLTLPEPLRIEDLLTTARGELWQPEASEIRLLARDERTAEAVLLSLHLRTGAVRELQRGRFSLETAGASSDPAQRLFLRESLSEPQALVELESSGAPARTIWTLEPRFEASGGAAAVSLAADVVGFDGTFRSAQTVVLLPPGQRAGELLPAVAFLEAGARLGGRGNLFGGGRVSGLPLAAFLERGFAVILLDGRISPEGQAGNPLTELRDAVLPQIQRAAEAGFVHRDKVAILGAGSGGYGAAGLLTTSSVFRAGIAISGYFDLQGLYGRIGQEEPDRFARFLEGGPGRMGGSPWSEPRRYAENSPYLRADRLAAPLLLLAGDAPGGIPADESLKMLTALRRLGKRGTCVLYPGEPECVGDWSLPHAADALARILAFVGRELRGDR